MLRRSLLGVVAALALAIGAVSAPASAPPVGPLPKGPLTRIHVQHGLLFALVLPRPAAGLTWRGARLSDATIARPLDEGELNGNIVFVYRAGHAGRTTVVYALTKGEGPKALKARSFEVTVS
jgi:alkylation response protein AidB-like acyl-CoA dehydrogenase